MRWGNVIGNATDGNEIARALLCLPFSQELNERIAWSIAIKHLGNKVNVGYQCRLKNNGHVASIKQLDWVYRIRW